MTRFLRSRAGIALTVVVALVGVALLLTHRNHLGDAWPYLLLILFPLMHLFGHGGHGGHGANETAVADAPKGQHQHPGDDPR